MATGQKQVQEFARQLLRLSVVDGAVSPERVAGVLAYVEKHRPAHAMGVLKAYRRLIAAEIARSQAVVEHAGPVSAAMLDDIAAVMSKRYGRRIAPVDQRNDALIAGMRVRVGDDTYESSVAGQLAVLAASV